MRALGIDIGGTGIKGAVVELESGALVSERVRERTPLSATPEAAADVVVRVCERLVEGGWLTPDLPAGAGVPVVVKGGVSMTAANVDASWIGAPIEALLRERLGRAVVALNDADAAGLAEVAFGAGKGHAGVILLLTIGTGIGSALIVDGRLVPNTELGHLLLHGRGAETLVSGAARERRHRGWKRWAREFNEYLALVESYLWPDLLILGGGVSKEIGRYERYLRARAPIVPAAMLNTSGIVGAAMAAVAVPAAEARGVSESMAEEEAAIAIAGASGP
ncbi:MAG TPA: ROK family protein [Candidatus Dormibacteraeota bacterium]|nr:ROK family protein [Candidatus Dormibacteraeota bacterium]